MPPGAVKMEEINIMQIIVIFREMSTYQMAVSGFPGIGRLTFILDGIEYGRQELIEGAVLCKVS